MVLLDTCALLWLVCEQARFPPDARALLEQNAGNLFASAISAFEIGNKCRRGALTLPLPAQEWWAEALSFHGLREIPVSGAIALRATLLPPLNADPCDRVIVATAQERGLSVVTPDPRIARYPDVNIVW